MKKRLEKKAFTLTELLVVIAIVALLAGLAGVALTGAMKSVRENLVKLEIDQLAMKLEQYKKDFGEYPPDNFTDADAVVRHLRKRWPRFVLTGTNNTDKNDLFRNLVNAATANIAGKTPAYDLTTISLSHTMDPLGWDLSDFNYAGSIAFWLGGLPDTNGSGDFEGFAANPEEPIRDYANQRTTPLMELKTSAGKGQNVIFDSNNVPIYVIRDLPVVYFTSCVDGEYTDHSSHTTPKSYVIGNFAAVPYSKTGTAVAGAKWHEPKKFQLIHPGLDGDFSQDFGMNPETLFTTPNTDFPAPTNLYSLFRSFGEEASIGYEDRDNITNFTKGARLDSEL